MDGRHGSGTIVVSHGMDEMCMGEKREGIYLERAR